VLRFIVPDLDKGMQACLRNDRYYFLIPARSSQASRDIPCPVARVRLLPSPAHARFFDELRLKAGCSGVNRCRCKETGSALASIVEPDSREQESLFIEAIK
jgi:hypothetical protein